MKQNGIDYNFGRMLRVVFWRPGVKYVGTSTNPANVEYIVEYCPQLSSNLCTRMEVNITDIPSSPRDDKPGYTSKITIYNAPPDLLELIAKNATSLLQPQELKKIELMNPEKREQAVENSVSNYYKSRLQVSVYAGYWQGINDLTEEEAQTYITGTRPTESFSGRTSSFIAPDVVGYVPVFHGYVNETTFFRKGQDNILTIAAHDICIEEMNVSSLAKNVTTLKNAGAEQAAQRAMLNAQRFRGYGTWAKTFKKLVTMLAPESELYQDTGSQSIVLPRLKTNDNGGAISRFDQYYKIYYVKSRTAFENANITKETDIDATIMDDELKTILEGQGHLTPTGSIWALNGGKKAQTPTVPQWENYKAYGATRNECLDNLCKFSGANLGFYRLPNQINNKVVYLVYRLGGDTAKIVEAKDADIKIYNFQNLLEAPSVGGNGSMTIKMLHNPKCRPLARIALIWDNKLGKDQGFLPSTSFEAAVTTQVNGEDTVLGPLGGLSSSAGMGASIAINQINGNLSVSIQRAQLETATQGGYMFNTGFPIYKAEHVLQTHGNAWTTTVYTIPMIAGIKAGDKK